MFCWHGLWRHVGQRLSQADDGRMGKQMRKGEHGVYEDRSAWEASDEILTSLVNLGSQMSMLCPELSHVITVGLQARGPSLEGHTAAEERAHDDSLRE